MVVSLNVYMCTVTLILRTTPKSYFQKIGDGSLRQLLLCYLDFAELRQQLNIPIDAQNSCLFLLKAKKCTFHTVTLILAVCPT